MFTWLNCKFLFVACPSTCVTENGIKVQLNASLIINICQTPLSEEQQKSQAETDTEENETSRFNLVWCCRVGVFFFLHFSHFQEVKNKQQHEEFYRMQDVQKFNSCWPFLLLLLVLFRIKQKEKTWMIFCNFVDMLSRPTKARRREIVLKITQN